MAANITIRSVELRPNPVLAGEAFTISVEIGDRLSVLADADGGLLADADGALMWLPEGAAVLADHDGGFLVDADGTMMESEE